MATPTGPQRFIDRSDADTVEGLPRQSARGQREVVERLGLQVQRAVERLVGALDRVDRDRGRTLLAGVADREAYEAAVAVMMRLVFLLCAEEHRLLPAGDPPYDARFAVSTLGARLLEEESRLGPQALEGRHAAWARLLATFRAVHAGVQHEQMRLPAYGGSLFDPDRFPFLEGRARGTCWRVDPSDPLPIDDRTVLRLLDALQSLPAEAAGGAERQRLSYRALDVEQLGHVYEGLLDHAAQRAQGPVLRLKGSGGAEPEVPLARLEELRAQGLERLVQALADETRRSEKALRKCVDREAGGDEARQLMRACGGDVALCERVRPFAGLLRSDEEGRPAVVLDGSLYVTRGDDRRATGTHYTPQALAEEVVRAALEPLCYDGPAQGRPKEEWRLAPAGRLLSLKVCDLAMGSGAFLVQACRYLAERLVEAWEAEGALPTGAPSEEALPRDLDERLAVARRLVADRCLFGVDKNPMAVEMAKLSLWLVTLQKDRPFTFLDHALRAGDALMGVASLSQVERFDLSAREAANTRLAQRCKSAVQAALAKRRLLESLAGESAADVERKGRLLAEAERALAEVRLVADLLVGIDLREEGAARQAALADAKAFLEHALDPSAEPQTREKLLRELEARARRLLGDCRPVHWPLDFPEAFPGDEGAGFDAFVGNPPFLGGTRISTVLGSRYFDALKRMAPGTGNRADLVVYFFRRAFALARDGGTLGFLATNTASQGDSRVGGLEWILSNGGAVYSARRSIPWPGSAAVFVHALHFAKGATRPPPRIDGRPARRISAFLVDSDTDRAPEPLAANAGIAFEGFKIYGQGFLFDDDDPKATPLATMREILAASPRSRERVRPYLGGEEVNESPTHAHRRYVIDFGEATLEEARECPELLRIVEEKVRPERATKSGQVASSPWWRFFCARPELRRAVKGLRRVLVCSKVSSHLVFAWMPTTVAFSHKLAVFARDDDAFFGVVQSQVHEAFVRFFSSTLGEALNYSTTDAFDPFPLPDRLEQRPRLSAAAAALHASRAQVMVREGCGLTKLYNRFHDPGETGPGLEGLRRLHRELDEAVAEAYGWGGLALEHGFHGEGDGVRYGLSEPARGEVVGRLLRLNQERRDQERGRPEGRAAAQELRPRAAPARAARPRPARQEAFAFSAAGSGGGGERPAGGTAGAEEAILACLLRAAAPLSKAQVLASCGIDEADWTEAIGALLAREAVTAEGKARGRKYRIPNS